MSTALLDAPRRSAPRRARTAGSGRPTLAELLTGTLHAARARNDAECPVCHGSMRFEQGAARCESCGTSLS
jgi:hypothetical protein